MQGGVALRVLSWNLQGRGPERLGLRELVEQGRPDVLLLQEADADRLAGTLPAEYITQLAWPTAGTPPGIAIVARLPVTDQGLLSADAAPWDRPRVAWARLRLAGGQSMTAASVHLRAPLGLWPPAVRAQRDAQLAALAAWAAGIAADEPMIVGGDFNCHQPRLAPLHDAAGPSAGNTWRGVPVRAIRPLLRLDAIFVSASVRVAAAAVLDAFAGSDHCPVAATIVVGTPNMAPDRSEVRFASPVAS